MKNKFKTPHIAYQNVISFTCSDDSIKPLLELFGKLRGLGQMGCSRDVTINWDGDGRDRLENISVNGMTLTDWENEWNRLNDCNPIKQSSDTSEVCEENKKQI